MESEEAEGMSDLARDVVGREAGEEDLKELPRRIQPKLKMITRSFKPATDGREDVHIMKWNASPALERLHKSLDKMAKEKSKLEQEMRQRMATDSLVLE